MRIAYWTRALIAVLSLAAVFCPVFTQHFNDTLYFSLRSKRSVKKQQPNRYRYDTYYKHEMPLLMMTRVDADIVPPQPMTLRQTRLLLKEETKNRSAAAVAAEGVDCCPAVLEMIEPEGGKNQEDQYVELWRKGENRQRFYEMSCHQDILNKPCRFIDKKLHGISRCIQKYSYTYALVKETARHHHGDRNNRTNHRNHNHHHNNQNHPTGGHKAFPSLTSPSSSDGQRNGADNGSEEGGYRWTMDYIKVRSGCSCAVIPQIPEKKGKKHNGFNGRGKRVRHEATLVEEDDWN